MASKKSCFLVISVNYKISLSIPSLSMLFLNNMFRISLGIVCWLCSIALSLSVSNCATVSVTTMLDLIYKVQPVRLNGSSALGSRVGVSFVFSRENLLIFGELGGLNWTKGQMY